LKSQIFNTKCEIKEKIFVSFLGLSLFISFLKLFYFSSPTFINILLFLTLLILFSALSFLVYFDLKKMEVHRSVSFFLMSILLVINILLFLLIKDEIQITSTWIYSPYQNILGAIALGAIFQLIVLLTKEKALGQGDVRISIIVGLLIGFNNLLSWGYIAIFTSLIYGLLYAIIKKKKVKGLKIPFVPFMLLGVITILLLKL